MEVSGLEVSRVNYLYRNLFSEPSQMPCVINLYSLCYNKYYVLLTEKFTMKRIVILICYFLSLTIQANSNWYNINSIELYTQFKILPSTGQQQYNDSIDVVEVKAEKLNQCHDQIAKIHLIATLLGKDHQPKLRYHNGTIFPAVDNSKIGIAINDGYDIAQSLDPMHFPITTRLFRMPFKHYTLSNAATLLTWLEDGWNEEQIKQLLQNSNGNNITLPFIDFKNRYERIKSTLIKIKNNEYLATLISPHEQSANISQQPLRRAFKNIVYQEKPAHALPTVLDQMFLCHNGSRAWLELSNYKFMLNGETSNTLITMYFGLKSGEELTVATMSNVIREPLAIYDPETVFVFQHAIIKYWEHSSTATLLDIAQAIHNGYTAVAYHFNQIKSPQDTTITTSFSSIHVLHDFVNEIITTKIQPMITQRCSLEAILKTKQKGLLAYYPNPCYLPEHVIKFLRDAHITYYDYYDSDFKIGFSDLLIKLHAWDSDPIQLIANNNAVESNQDCVITKQSNHEDYNPRLLLKSHDSLKLQELYKNNQNAAYIVFDSKIYVMLNHIGKALPAWDGLEKFIESLVFDSNGRVFLTTEQFNYLTSKTDYTPKNLSERISCLDNRNYIVFRGDHRPPEQVFENQGFVSCALRTGEALSRCTAAYRDKDIVKYIQDLQQYNNNDEKISRIKQIPELWKFSAHEGTYDTYSTDNMYISTTPLLNIAKAYANQGGNVYAIRTNQAIELPLHLKNNKGNSLSYETVIPFSVPVSDIIGARHRDGLGSLLVGPVFIQAGLEVNNEANFWELLQTLGDKPQYKKLNPEKNPEIMTICNDDKLIDQLYTGQSSVCPFIYKTIGLDNLLEEQAICSKDDYRDDILKICAPFTKAFVDHTLR